MTQRELEVFRSIIREEIRSALRHFRRKSSKPEGLMSLSQAADFLGMSPKRLIALRKSGLVRGVLLPGGKQWRYRREELDRFIGSQVIKT